VQLDDKPVGEAPASKKGALFEVLLFAEKLGTDFSGSTSTSWRKKPVCAAAPEDLPH